MLSRQGLMCFNSGGPLAMITYLCIWIHSQHGKQAQHLHPAECPIGDLLASRVEEFLNNSLHMRYLGTPVDMIASGHGSSQEAEAACLVTGCMESSISFSPANALGRIHAFFIYFLGFFCFPLVSYHSALCRLITGLQADTRS
ncbi:hypothetical protein BDZ91DRAFT_309648 [Kalaharituber pfeilii]|nr:hypothetical protein BDZ91DRAFT_309648 [Kalaharituber pfeilii]